MKKNKKKKNKGIVIKGIEDYKFVEFSNLVNKTLIKINIHKEYGKINFYCSDGTIYSMFHDQLCCECVYIEEIIGNIDDLIDSPILMAEETSNSGDKDEGETHYTWTFYKLATIKGYVTIRWYGTSNGYYSERAELVQITGLIL